MARLFGETLTGTGENDGTTFDIGLLGTTEGATTGAFSQRLLDETIEYDPDLWESKTLGDNSYLKPMFEAAKKGLELHKANAKFIKGLYEANKALMYATIDPIFAAIDRILEEIINILNSLRGLGFYMLAVTTQSVQQNIQKNPITGALHVGDHVYLPATINSKGEYVAANPGKDEAGNETWSNISVDAITGEQIYIKAQPLSTVASEAGKGGLFQKPQVGPEGKTKAFPGIGDLANEYFIQINQWTGLMELTPNGILNTIDESFDDAMDVPKHYKQMLVDKKLATKENGEALTVEDATEEGKSNLTDKMKEYLDDIINPNYYQSGRPTFPKSAKVAGVIFIIGAPDANRFRTVLYNFSKFISLKGFKDTLKDIDKILKPALPKRTVRLKQVCNINISKQQRVGESTEGTAISTQGAQTESDKNLVQMYKKDYDSPGAFQVQSKKKVIRIGKQDGLKVARVTKVISTKPMYIPGPGPKGELESWDQPLTESRIREREKQATVNTNRLPFQEQVLEVEMETQTGDFAPGDLLVELKPAPEESKILTENKDSTADAKNPDVDKASKAAGFKKYVQVKEGKVTVGTVKKAYSMTAQGKPPNWRGQSMEQMFPGLTQMFDRAESEIRSMQATVKSAKKILDPIIDFLDSKIDDAMAFAKDIENILDLFANGVPATGVYSLYLPPQPGGVEKFRERMMAAGGEFKPPEDLKYCAGVCFLGGGPDNHLLIKSIDTLALLLGFRNKSDSEKEDVATMAAAATPILDEEEVYNAGDTLYYKGKNYTCLVDATSGQLPLIQINGEGPWVINSTYWEAAAEQPGPDEEVSEGDVRTPEQIKSDKIAWLKAAKSRLEIILGDLDGIASSGLNMRKKINQVSLFGTINTDGEFVGENRNIYDELFQMRENDIQELDLLVFRIRDMLAKIELMQIQASPGNPFNAKTEPDGVRPGSLRSKGKTLLILNGEFVDEVDDFDSGQRRIKENTTITIMDPLSDSSGATRSIEFLSNTTVAQLDEPFPEDIDLALAYDIQISKTVSSDYDNDENQFETWNGTEFIANTTHYMHPGYRVREFIAKANTISVIMPNDSTLEYDTVPVWNSGEDGPEGAKRTTQYYPEGTIIKLNGVAPISEGFVMEDAGVTVVGELEENTTSWMGIGASTDDELLVDFGSENGPPKARIINETIGDDYLAIDDAFRLNDNAGVEQFHYHSEWEVKIADASQAEQNKKNKIQSSRNKFIKYLKTINETADNVYVDLQTLQDKTWPPAE